MSDNPGMAVTAELPGRNVPTTAQQEVLDPKALKQMLQDKTKQLPADAGDPASPNHAKFVDDLTKATDDFKKNNNQWTPQISDEFVKGIAEADNYDLSKVDSLMKPLKEEVLPKLLIDKNLQANLACAEQKEMNAAQLGQSKTDVTGLGNALQSLASLAANEELPDAKKAQVRDNLIKTIQGLSQPVGDAVKKLTEYEDANKDIFGKDGKSAKLGDLQTMRMASISARLTFVNAIFSDHNPKGLSESEAGLVTSLEQQSIAMAPSEMASNLQTQIQQMNMAYAQALQKAKEDSGEKDDSN